MGQSLWPWGLCHKGWDPAMGQAPHLWVEMEPPTGEEGPRYGAGPTAMGGSGRCVCPHCRGGAACYGAAPSHHEAWDRDPPWGRPQGQDGDTAAAVVVGGVQAGGPPPGRPGPTPPAAPPHSSASEPGWTPASAGGPRRRGRAGAGPPGAGWGGDGGGGGTERDPLPRVLGAPCPLPIGPLGRPHPALGRCGWPGGGGGGHSQGTGSALPGVGLRRSLLR